jgi:hypothetical protein
MSFVSTYVRGFAPGGNAARAVPQSSHARYIFCSILIFIGSNFCAQYALVANGELLEKMLDNVTKNIPPERREKAESARGLVETALKVPGAKFFISIRGVVVPVRTLLLFLAVFAIPCTILADRHGFLGEYALHASLLTIIPATGFIVNVCAKLAVLDPRVTFGPSLFIPGAVRGSVLEILLNQSDLFTLWYLLALSVVLARCTDERVAVFMAVAAGCWILLTLASYLADFPFALIT